MSSNQNTQAAFTAQGSQPKVVSVCCPLGCDVADTATLPAFEQQVGALKAHLSDAHGGIIEAGLDQSVLAYRYRFASDLDQVLQTSGYISSWPFRMECPLGCGSLPGLSPYQLQLHLESKHPGSPEAELLATELSQKYGDRLSDSIHHAPAHVPRMQSTVLAQESRLDHMMAFVMANFPRVLLNTKSSPDVAQQVNEPVLLMGLDGSMDHDTPVLDTQTQPAEKQLGALDILADAACDEWNARNAANILLGIHQRTVNERNAAPYPQVPEPNPHTATPSSSAQMSTPAPVNNATAFVCPTCNASLKTKANLRRHQDDVHLQLKPFRCPVCPRAFKRKFELQAHQLKTGHSLPGPGSNESTQRVG